MKMRSHWSITTDMLHKITDKELEEKIRKGLEEQIEADTREIIFTLEMICQDTKYYYKFYRSLPFWKRAFLYRFKTYRIMISNKWRIYAKVFRKTLYIERLEKVTDCFKWDFI